MVNFSQTYFDEDLHMVFMKRPQDGFQMAEFHYNCSLQYMK